ncbi:hypothetical protein Dimus_033700 [Dionaea muscipula]
MEVVRSVVSGLDRHRDFVPFRFEDSTSLYDTRESRTDELSNIEINQQPSLSLCLSKLNTDPQQLFPLSLNSLSVSLSREYKIEEHYEHDFCFNEHGEQRNQRRTRRIQQPSTNSKKLMKS